MKRMDKYDTAGIVFVLTCAVLSIIVLIVLVLELFRLGWAYVAQC